MAEDISPVAPVRPKTHRENRKKNRGRKILANQAMAVAKFLRVPPRKARLVADEIRGLYAQDALAFLGFVPNRAAAIIRKVLESAVANAVNNHNLDASRLKVVSARVDEGPRIKRIQPRAQGRVYRILHRMSHITLIVEEAEPKPRRVRRATRSRAQAARTARESAASRVASEAASTSEASSSPSPSGESVENEKPVTAVSEETQPNVESENHVSSGENATPDAPEQS